MSQNRSTITLFSSAARTATPTPRQALNKNNSSMQITIDVTAIAATPSVVFNVEGKDRTSDKWYLLLASAAITAVGTTTLFFGPGQEATANVSTPKSVPRDFRVRPVHADADSITYTVGANLVI